MEWVVVVQKSVFIVSMYLPLPIYKIKNYAVEEMVNINIVSKG